MPRIARHLIPASCFMFCLFFLGGCQLPQLFGSMGSKVREPLYKFPPGKRVLVFVDLRPDITVPPDFSAMLGQKISDELYQYKAADKLVAQARLTDLHHDPAKFARLGIADVARATDADYVLHVDVIVFNITTLSDESITQGLAQVLIKVVDINGLRAWPPATTAGLGVEARADPALSEQRDRTGVERDLADLLALRVSRNFFKLDLEDPAMAK